MSVNDLAASQYAGSYLPEILLSNEGDLITSASTWLDATPGAKYQLVALTATGLTAFVTGTHTAAQAVLLLQPATQNASAQFASFGGVFNHAVITWPAALDTFAKRLNFVQGSGLRIGQVQMTGNPAWAA